MPFGMSGQCTQRATNRESRYKIKYTIGNEIILFTLTSTPYFLKIEAIISQLSTNYSGVYFPPIDNKDNEPTIRKHILDKKAKISFTLKEMKLIVGGAIIKLKGTPSSEPRRHKVLSHPRAIQQIQKDIIECKENFKELKCGFKEIKSMMQKTIDIPPAEKLKEKYNFDDISLPTLKEYVNKSDKDGPKLSIFSNKIEDKQTNHIQNTVEIQNKEINVIKKLINQINTSKNTSINKIEGEFRQFRKDIYASLNLITKIIRKDKRESKDINTLMAHLKKVNVTTYDDQMHSRHSSLTRMDLDCDESACENREVEKSRNDGRMKKPMYVGALSTAMRKI
jgi:hypothetical protein